MPRDAASAIWIKGPMATSMMGMAMERRERACEEEDAETRAFHPSLGRAKRRANATRRMMNRQRKITTMEWF
jgi:hypothetical protein